MTSPFHAYLLFVSGLPVPKNVVMRHTPFVLGREATCDLVLESPKISRHHAELVFQHGHWRINDLDSRNGVWLNDSRLPTQTPTRLRHGDFIRLATVVTVRFEEADATLPETSTGAGAFTPGLYLDNHRRDFIINQRVVNLSPTEFKLLMVLYNAQGRVVSNDEIAEALWPEAQGNVNDQAIDTAIKRLRETLSHLDDHAYIETLRGRGRRFVPKP